MKDTVASEDSNNGPFGSLWRDTRSLDLVPATPILCLAACGDGRPLSLGTWGRRIVRARSYKVYTFYRDGSSFFLSFSDFACQFLCILHIQSQERYWEDFGTTILRIRKQHITSENPPRSLPCNSDGGVVLNLYYWLQRIKFVHVHTVSGRPVPRSGRPSQLARSFQNQLICTIILYKQSLLYNLRVTDNSLRTEVAFTCIA